MLGKDLVVGLVSLGKLSLASVRVRLSWLVERDKVNSGPVTRPSRLCRANRELDFGGSSSRIWWVHTSYYLARATFICGPFGIEPKAHKVYL